MSKAVSALGGVSQQGFVTVSDAGLRGMITLRGDLSSKKIVSALKGIGVTVPAARRIAMTGAKGAAWMSPEAR